MKIRRLNGFSLMEMMVVLLIIAIVLAATTPMVSRRMARVSEDGNGESLWEVVTDGIHPKEDYGSVIIGSDSLNDENVKPLLYIENDNSHKTQIELAVNSGGTKDSVWLGFEGESVFMAKNASEHGEKSTKIGYDAKAKNKSTAIGYDAEALSTGCVAIGYGAQINDSSNYSVAVGFKVFPTGEDSIAIGRDIQDMKGNYSIAIGYGAIPQGDNAMAIGLKAKATGENAVAIGPNAVAENEHDFVLGTDKHTVIIPGKLIVEGDVELGKNNESNVKLNALDKPNGEEHKIDQVYWNHDGGYTLTISDRRLKDVGEVFQGGLEELKKLDLYHFTFKNDEKKVPHVGVMAQDLQKIFPNAVIQGEDGFLKIRMEDMFYAVINAVKELDAKLTKLTEQVKANLDLITALQEKITTQEQEIITLKNQNAEFEKRLAKLEKKAGKKGE